MTWLYDDTNELMITLIVMLTIVSAIRFIKAKTKVEKAEIIKLWVSGNMLFVLVLLMSHYLSSIIRI